MESGTSDEGRMAGLAHLGILLPLLGLVVPLVLWGTHKDKSRFVAAHAAQAMAWQALLVVVWVLCQAAVAIVFTAAMRSVFFAATDITSGVDASGSADRAIDSVLLGTIAVPYWTGLVAAAATVVMIVVALVAAYQSWRGRPFRHPLIGRWFARFETPQSAEA